MQNHISNILEAKPLECASLLALLHRECNQSLKSGSKLPHFHEKVGDVKAQSQ